MKKTKLDKGITLIALIITIIVLLIIAVVTIGNIQESRVIGHTQNARSEYTIAQEKEQIALAYSEYQIKKALPNIEELELELELENEDATIEQISDLGWKVSYANTGNVYGINSNGEYDEAISMIIEASEATGLGLDCFMIYEDQYAINANKTAGSTTMPERYVFYNWNKLTVDQMVDIETNYEPTLESEKVCNLTNRLCTLDVDGNGIVEEDDHKIVNNLPYVTNDNIMSSEKHNMLAQICKKDDKTVHDILLEGLECSYDEERKVYYYDENENNICDEEEIIDARNDKFNFLIKYDIISEGPWIEQNDGMWYRRIIVDNTYSFNEIYTSHIYYNSERVSL